MHKQLLSRGFTIVELLVVIVVIGLLATIVTVAYSTVTQRATTASLQSDLTQGKKQIESYYATNGLYPTANNCTNTLSTEICLKPSGGNAFAYSPNTTSNPTGYSLVASRGTTSYQVASASPCGNTSIPNIITNGLVLNLDAGNPTSYSGSGTTWTDLSGSGNNGTLVNGPTYSCSNGGSIVFDGVNVYVSSSLSNPGTLPITFDFWINSDSSSPIGLFDSAPGQANVLRNYGSGRIEWWSDSPGISLGLTALTWNNIVIEYSFNTNRVINYYRNGLWVSTTTGSSLNSFSWTNLRFGDINNGNAGRYSGKVSVIKIYHRALTSSEISQNFNAVRARFGI